MMRSDARKRQQQPEPAPSELRAAVDRAEARMLELEETLNEIIARLWDGAHVESGDLARWTRVLEDDRG